MLLQIPDILTPHELDAVCAGLATGAWVDGRETAGPQARAVKNNEQLDARSSTARSLQAIVLGALRRHPLFFSAALPRRILPPLFNRYGGTLNHYGNHVDQAIRCMADGGNLRTDLSCTLFLASPGDYDGGELIIEDAFGSRSVKLPAGHLVVYPGTSVHRVEPVTRGARLASFFWVQSLVRSAELRRLLFDLDMALMQLRQRHGESAETVALTGTYHNLLRLWAES